MARERGRGSTLGRAGRRAAPWGRCRARGKGLEGAGARAWARRGLGLSRGRSGLPGVEWRGRRGPQRRCTNRRRTRSRQEAREGGRAQGGAGPPGNPSLSGPRGSARGGASPLTPPPPRPPSGLRSRGSSGIAAPGLPGDSEGAWTSRSPRPARSPQPPGAEPSRPAPPPSGRGRGGASPQGQGRGIPAWLRPGTGRRATEAGVGGCPGYWGQGGISPAQAGLG